MISTISRLLSWSHRHRRVVVAAALCLVALSALGIRRLSFDTDVLSLLPRDGRVIPAFRTFVERFGSLDDLYVVFTAPPGQSIAEYDDEISAWVDRLRQLDGISRVDTGRPDRSQDLGWLADRQLLLLGDRPFAQAIGRLGGDGMRAAIAGRRELLALPSPDVAEIVKQDPLALHDLLRDELGGAQAGISLGVSGTGYMTADSRSRLLIARPSRPPYDAAFSRELIASLASIRGDVARARLEGTVDGTLPPLDVDITGGHAIAVETEAVIRRESVLNTAGSLALILPLLFLVFRSAWLVTVGALPSALALVVALGLLGLAGATLSAAATASAAMLFGLGVDGVVLLYVSYTHAAADAGDRPTAIERLGGAAFSMLLGMWTTAATFYGLAIVDFPSLQQLGALVGHSMVLCGLFTLLLVPALLPRASVARRRRPLRLPRLAAWVIRHRVAVRVAALLLTLALGAAATGVRIDPTLDRLRSVTPAAALLDEIGPRFNLPHDVYLIVQRGVDLEPLLVANERMTHQARLAAPGVRLYPASALLPSQATQARRASALGAAQLSAPLVAERLDVAARAEGFAAGAFAPFLDRLPRLLSPEQRLSLDGYVDHGLADLVGRFVSRGEGDWLVASYAVPATDADVASLQRAIEGAGTLTGLPLVNRELAARFLPQFLQGLGAGSLVVLVLIAVALRNWRLSLLALVPAVIGLIWAAGLLALARIELDLFALFAVVSFVGIGVDYGIHLVQRYRETGDVSQAVAELAPVILVAAAITLLGYGTLISSSYPPLRSIGIVSVVAIVTLAAAALLVLPALLSAGAQSPPPQPLRPAAIGGVDRGPADAPAARGAMRIAALIPAFNEAGSIRLVIEGLRGVVDWVLVVDDGSTDGTAAQASAAGAEVVTLESNRGKGIAVRAGLAALADRSVSHILLLDADLQHLPSEAPRLIAAAAGGADLVLGERTFDRAAMPGSRYHANRLGSLALSRFVGVPLRDTQCGFRVVKVTVLDGLALRSRGYEIETEMLVKLWRRGARIVTVPITAVYAGQVSKLRPVRDTTRTCFLAVYHRYIERL